MKTSARFGPVAAVFVFHPPLYVISMVLVGLGAPESGGVGWLVAMLGASVAVLAVQSLGACLHVAEDTWLVRGVLRERTIPTRLVVGVSFETPVDIVVVGGVSFLARLFAVRPRQARRLQWAERLSRVSGIDVPVLTRAEVDSMRRQLAPEEIDLLRSCRSRWVRPLWWQWALYGVWLLVVVLLAT